METNFKQLIKQVRVLALDVDGVLTDGSVLCTEHGDQIRTMNIKDGYALQLANKMGLRIVIISGGHSQGVRLRLERLGIQEIHLGIKEKLPFLESWCIQHQTRPDEIAYLGDDIPDYKCMKWTGVAACPKDAAQEIRAISHYVSPFGGGKGCVRDVVEQILKTKNMWMNEDAFIW